MPRYLEDLTIGELNPLDDKENKTGNLWETLRNAGKRDTTKEIRWKGIVLRQEKLSKGTSFLDRYHHDEGDLVKVKVRIPEIHAALPVPELDFAGTHFSSINSSIIDMYPTFVGLRGDLPDPQVGSVVYVGFENIERLEGAIYIGPVETGFMGGIIETSPKAKKGDGAKFIFDSKGTFLKDSFNSFFQPNVEGKMKILTVEPDKVLFGSRRGSSGYGIRIREDFYEPLLKIKNIINSLGSTLVSRESQRNFDVSSGAATSLHYPALAVDLWIEAGMYAFGDPITEQYVVEKDPSNNGKFIVWARSNKSVGTTYEGYSVESKKINALDIRQTVNRTAPQYTKVEGNFVNLTQIFLDNGFNNISAKSKFWSKSGEKSSEWWHFEVRPFSFGETYGDVLTKVFEEPPKGEDGPPWKQRDRTWTGKDFKV